MSVHTSEKSRSVRENRLRGKDWGKIVLAVVLGLAMTAGLASVLGEKNAEFHHRHPGM